MRNHIRGLAALLALVFLAGNVHAWHHRSGATVSYYYAAPAYAPGFRVVYPMPAVSAPFPVMPPLYAVPMPAPALDTGVPPCPPSPVPGPVAPPSGVPPQTMPPAGVTETPSTQQRTNYYAGPSRNQPAPGLYSVFFRNLSGTDLTLRINGEVRALRNGRGLALELGREFTWQIEGRPAQVERIPVGESGVELVLRR